MRKYLSIALAMLMTMLIVGTAKATCNSDTDKFTSDQWCIDNQDTLIPTASAGQKVVYELNSTSGNNTLATEETGKIIVDQAGVKHILPRASAGLIYTFVAGYKDGTGAFVVMTIDTVDTSDTIIYRTFNTVLDAGDSIKNEGGNNNYTSSDSVTLFSPVANKWFIVNMNGKWLDNGTN